MSTMTFEAPPFLDTIVRKRFIETGLYAGDTMAFATTKPFERMDGIEISPQWANHCSRRFQHDPRVNIHCGSSPKVLRDILYDEPTTFWLDAHFTGDPLRPELQDPTMGECPLLRELRVITEFPWTERPMILIDDMHMFEGTFWSSKHAEHFKRNQWPVLAQIYGHLAGYTVVVHNQIMYAY